jgi:O-antigen/teichoic acid export membrane protein
LVGHISASITAAIISGILLYFLIFRKLDKVKTKFSEVAKAVKPLLSYGIPLSISAIMSGITAQFYQVMMASYVRDLALIGNYKVATNFAILLTFFSSPLTTALFPAFSKLNYEKEPKLAKRVFSSSIKYSSLILVPATMLLIVLSDTIISALYGAKWAYAPSFLSLSIVGYLLVSALGQTRLIMKINFLTLATGIPLGFILVPWLGIYGVILCLLVTNAVGVFVLSFFISKKYGAKADLNISGRIFLGSLLATGVVYLFLISFELSSWIELGIGFILFSVSYLILIPLISAINKTDINNLREVFSGLGPLSKIIEVALTIMEKPLEFRSHDKLDETDK